MDILLVNHLKEYKHNSLLVTFIKSPSAISKLFKRPKNSDIGDETNLLFSKKQIPSQVHTIFAKLKICF